MDDVNLVADFFGEDVILNKIAENAACLAAVSTSLAQYKRGDDIEYQDRRATLGLYKKNDFKAILKKLLMYIMMCPYAQEAAEEITTEEGKKLIIEQIKTLITNKARENLPTDLETARKWINIMFGHNMDTEPKKYVSVEDHDNPKASKIPFTVDADIQSILDKLFGKGDSSNE